MVAWHNVYSFSRVLYSKTHLASIFYFNIPFYIVVICAFLGDPVSYCQANN